MSGSSSLPRSASDASTDGMTLQRIESISSMARLLESSAADETNAAEIESVADDPMRARFSRRPYSVCAPGSDKIVSPALCFDDGADTQPFGDYHRLPSRSRITAQFERIISPLPPTSNELSSTERRQMVRKSRKLQAMLGATLAEIDVEKSLRTGKTTPVPETRRTTKEKSEDIPEIEIEAPVLPRAARTHTARQPSDPVKLSSIAADAALAEMLAVRRSSPASAPASPSAAAAAANAYDAKALPPALDYNDLFDDDDVGSPFSLATSDSMTGSTTDFTSPETGLSPETPASSDEFSPWSSSGGLGRTREDRRRKLDKIHRFLGEHVPLAVVHTPNGPAMVVDTSALQQHQPAPTKSISARSMLGKFNRFKLNARKPQLGSEEDLPSLVVQSHKRSAPSLAMSDNSMASIRRAKKLEKMFGELPPTALHAPIAPTAPKRINPFIPRGGDPADRTRAYRRSIASLAYMAENDPHSLDHLAKLYHLYSSPVTQEFESDDMDVSRNSDNTEDCAPSIASGVPTLLTDVDSSASTHSGATSRSSLSEQHATHVKRAKKLASFFGTTRGDVFNRVLDDLQAAVEEEDLPMQERNKLLGEVRQLRASPGLV